MSEQQTIKCEDCGEIKECTWTSDPFRDEIYGDETKHWLCEDCCFDSAQDI